MTRPDSCGEFAGTHAGVNRHRKAWEPLCEACRVFRNAYAKARRESADVAEKARRESAIRHWAIKRLIGRHRAEFGELLRQGREVAR